MKTKWKAVLLFCCAAGAALCALALLGPDSWIFPGCLLRRTTGFSCAGCGMTHAFSALLRLDFPAAFRANALAVPLILTGILVLAKPSLAKKPVFWVCLLGTVLLFALLRNLPYFPFTLLAPH